MPEAASSRRLLCRFDLPKRGILNMAIDRCYLYVAETSPTPITILRFYQWSVPAVSVGRNQQLERCLDMEACRRHGIDVVRRPTGGRAVLHHQEVTYSITSNDGALFPLQNLSATYRMVASALQTGLRMVGVETRLAPLRPWQERAEVRSQTPCFASPARHELLSRGRKIAGSAQRRLRRSFLQHGSIPLDLDFQLMEQLLRAPADGLRSRMVSVNQVAPSRVDFNRLSLALLWGFQTVLGIRFVIARPAEILASAPQTTLPLRYFSG